MRKEIKGVRYDIGYICHVLSRTNCRLHIFRRHDVLFADEQVMVKTIQQSDMRLSGFFTQKAPAIFLFQLL